MKEVAPNCQAHELFWRHDVKIARDYNTTLYGASAAEILRSVVKCELLPALELRLKVYFLDLI